MALWGPADPEKLIFAVDVTKCLLLRHHPHLLMEFIKTDASKDAESCRRGISSDHFDTNIRKMIEEIDETQVLTVSREFRNIKEEDDISESSLRDYIQAFKDENLPRAFSNKEFLTFCVRVSLMSLRFFEYGRYDAVDIGVQYIKDAFPDDKKECKLVWKNMKTASKNYSVPKGDAATAASRRESASIGSEDSSNSSSASNTGSDSTAEAANMTSTSSAESLHEHLNFKAMNLNTSSLECANNVEIKEPQVQIEPMEAKHSIRVTFAAADSSVESSDADSKECAPISTSSTIGESNVKDTSVPSDTLTFPMGELNIKEKIDIPLPSPEAETLQNASPKKSLLGKRPSPRRANPIKLRNSAAYDSETEIKKPKLESPDKDTTE